MKNTKPNVSNLFVHIISPRFRASQIRKELKIIGHDLVANMHEKIGKLWFANQIFFTSMHGFLIKFSNPNRSYIHIHANLIQNTLPAAP